MFSAYSPQQCHPLSQEADYKQHGMKAFQLNVMQFLTQLVTEGFDPEEVPSSPTTKLHMYLIPLFYK